MLRKILSLFFTYLAKRNLVDKSRKIKANGYTVLSKNTSLGDNVHFNGLKIYGSGQIKIGNNFHSGFGCKIITSYHDYNGTKIPYDENVVIKDVSIGDNVWLGINVIILGGVSIGEGAIIQAGSVVVANIESCAIAGGHPAKVFSFRNIDKYNKLKARGSFF